MKNMKFWRTALVATLVLTVMLSVTGGTIAWFTDSVTSGNNIITSGKLDVAMHWADGKNAVPADDSTEWTDASTGAIFNYDLWEPGYVQVRHVKIANTGTLALKYKVEIEPTGEVTDLTDVIDVYYTDPAAQVADRTALTDANKMGTLTQVLAGMATTAAGELEAGKSDTITIALKMQESAGNEYQGKSIGDSFKLVLVATQLMSEEDSFGPEYDEDALYPGEVGTANAVVDALQAGESVKLGADVKLDESITISTDSKASVLDLNGNSLTTASYNVTYGNVHVPAGATLTIQDSGNGGVLNGVVLNEGNLNITGGYIKSAAFEDIGGAVVCAPDSYGFIPNLNITGGTIEYCGSGIGAAITVTDTNGRKPKVHIGGDAKIISKSLCMIVKTNVTITGGNFVGYAQTIEGMSLSPIWVMDGGTVTITGGTFNFDPSQYVADGYRAVHDTATGLWTVSAK